MSTPTPFLVELTNIGTSRGRGTAVAQIPDAKDIGVSQQAAQEFINAYFAGFPSVRAFIDNLIATARESGVVTAAPAMADNFPNVYANHLGR